MNNDIGIVFVYLVISSHSPLLHDYSSTPHSIVPIGSVQLLARQVPQKAGHKVHFDLCDKLRNLPELVCLFHSFTFSMKWAGNDPFPPNVPVRSMASKENNNKESVVKEKKVPIDPDALAHIWPKDGQDYDNFVYFVFISGLGRELHFVDVYKRVITKLTAIKCNNFSRLPSFQRERERESTTTHSDTDPQMHDSRKLDTWLGYNKSDRFVEDTQTDPEQAKNSIVCFLLNFSGCQIGEMGWKNHSKNRLARTSEDRGYPRKEIPFWV
mmetsp:Transcript_35902/g.40830  ORF Transcript_35902/g.40830 Transcript_35902/m.40830 type:complete len:268 (+) Transcript_35902:608-1411(+)